MLTGLQTSNLVESEDEELTGCRHARYLEDYAGAEGWETWGGFPLRPPGGPVGHGFSFSVRSLCFSTITA